LIQAGCDGGGEVPRTVGADDCLAEHEFCCGIVGRAVAVGVDEGDKFDRGAGYART
jgi:hypothetical protein